VTGGKADILLLAPSIKYPEKNVWRCLVQPTPKDGQAYEFAGAEAKFLERDHDAIPLIEFEKDLDVRAFAEANGTMPLPPYIKREADGSDKSSYQTVYARHEGAVAAPTAGLHFTNELLQHIENKGVTILSVTLHVGYGTFKPVEDMENHRMHAEHFELREETAKSLNETKKNGGRSGLWGQLLCASWRPACKRKK